MDTLDDADLVYLGIHAKHDMPINRDHVLRLIEEVQAWRELGSSPEDLEESLEALRWDLELAEEALTACGCD